MTLNFIKHNVAILLLIFLLSCQGQLGSNSRSSVSPKSSQIDSSDDNSKIINSDLLTDEGLESRERDETESNIDGNLDLEDQKNEQIIINNTLTIEERGKSAKLLPSQVQKLLNLQPKSYNLGLKSLGVVIPSYIPPGFIVSHLDTPPGKIGSDVHTYYKIQYQNKVEDSCFEITHYAFDGPIGDAPDSVNSIENISVPGLGIEIDIGYVDFIQIYEIPSVISHMKEIDDFVFYKLSSPIVHFSDKLCSNSVEPREAKKILESLQYLDPKIDQPLRVESYLNKVQ